jgi:tRNA nucleotidyltransferase (CCA-adding enzyme)
MLDFDIPDYASDPLVQLLLAEDAEDEADVLVSCYRAARHAKATSEIERTYSHDHIQLHTAFPYV